MTESIDHDILHIDSPTSGEKEGSGDPRYSGVNDGRSMLSCGAFTNTRSAKRPLSQIDEASACDKETKDDHVDSSKRPVMKKIKIEDKEGRTSSLRCFKPDCGTKIPAENIFGVEAECPVCQEVTCTQCREHTTKDGNETHTCNKNQEQKTHQSDIVCYDCGRSGFRFGQNYKA